MSRHVNITSYGFILQCYSTNKLIKQTYYTARIAHIVIYNSGRILSVIHKYYYTQNNFKTADKYSIKYYEICITI
jgi:hypothetical protein